MVFTAFSRVYPHFQNSEKLKNYRRKYRSIKNEKMYPTLSHSPSEMFDLLKKGLLQEPDNVIFYTVKDSFKLNQARYEEAESKQLAAKM